MSAAEHKALKRRIALAIGQLSFARAFVRETGQGRTGGRRSAARVIATGEVVDTYVGETTIRFGVVGGADVEAFVAPLGRHVEIEAKTGAGRQSPEQKMFAGAVEPFGVLYIVARTVEEAVEAVTQAHQEDTALVERARHK